jgi:trehalose synthase
MDVTERKDKNKTFMPLPDGTVYSRRKNFRTLTSPSLAAYAGIIGNERIARLQKAVESVGKLTLLELNGTAQGGGVAEMLRSYVPFLDSLGVETEWKVITGNKEYFECTKGMHNLLQGMKGSFTAEMERTYLDNLQACADMSLIDYIPDVVTVHDPQPLGLTHYLKKPEGIWLWRCHIDIEEASLKNHTRLIGLVTDFIEHYDAAIFSAAHYVVSRWPMPKFIIPPFIDPLSDKNRDLSSKEIERVMDRLRIDRKVPLVLQVGRFDPWKGIDRTIAAFRKARKERNCQLVIVGSLAGDDPEGERVLAQIYEDTKDDKDIHVLDLPPTSHLEINALQRAASVIMQPSTREGFGLVVTEALWKAKPVITADVGGIPLQVRDGSTGYFYRSPHRAVERIVYLLDNPAAARKVGEAGRKYVAEHFLMPDRLADYLMAINITRNASRHGKIPPDSIISFHPWFKLKKRR